MSDLTFNQLSTLKILKRDTNAKEPLTGTAIAKRIGLKERKAGVQGADMRSIIHSLRVKGYPVCANGRGYFYARTQEELSKFIMSMEGRLLKQEEAIKGLKGSFEKAGEGKELDEEATTEIYVRTPKGTIAKMKIKVKDGAGILPAGYSLV